MGVRAALVFLFSELLYSLQKLVNRRLVMIKFRYVFFGILLTPCFLLSKRLFVALDLPPTINFDAAKKALGTLNNFSPEKLQHVTLVFIGETTKTEEIKKALQKIANSIQNISGLTIQDGIVPLGTKDPRPLVINLVQNTALNNLSAQIRTALQSILGPSFNPMGFHAHITLGRAPVASLPSSYMQIEAPDGARAKYNQTFTATSFTLYESTRGGYNSIEKYNLITSAKTQPAPMPAAPYKMYTSLAEFILDPNPHQPSEEETKTIIKDYEQDYFLNKKWVDSLWVKLADLKNDDGSELTPQQKEGAIDFLKKVKSNYRVTQNEPEFGLHDNLEYWYKPGFPIWKYIHNYLSRLVCLVDRLKGMGSGSCPSNEDQLRGIKNVGGASAPTTQDFTLLINALGQLQQSLRNLQAALTTNVSVGSAGATKQK